MYQFISILKSKSHVTFVYTEKFTITKTLRMKKTLRKHENSNSVDTSPAAHTEAMSVYYTLYVESN